MTRLTQTRRRFLAAGTGTVLAGAIGGLRTLVQEGGWTTADAPIEGAINDVVQSSQGPYAVGEGGVVLARRADGWEAVLERGPTVESNPLTGAGVTEDGDHVWFAEGSGVVGRYDAVDEELTDHSAPDGKTSTWEAVAVTGAAGEETVHLTNGSGEYLNGTVTDEGGVDWGEVVKPGGGSTAPGIDFVDSETGYIADTTSQVYETTDSDDSWETIGVDGGSAGYNDIVARSPEEIYVAAGDGTVLRYNGAVWTVHWAGGSELNAVDASDDDVVTAGASGTIVERTTREWATADTPTEATTYGIALNEGGVNPGLVVGNPGTIFERVGTAVDDPDGGSGDGDQQDGDGQQDDRDQQDSDDQQDGEDQQNGDDGQQDDEETGGNDGDQQDGETDKDDSGADDPDGSDDPSDGTDDGDEAGDSAENDPDEDNSEASGDEDGSDAADDPEDDSGDGGQEDGSDDDPDGGDAQDQPDDGDDGDASADGETGADAPDADESDETDDGDETPDGDADAEPDGSDGEDDSAGTASLTATEIDADGSGQYEVGNDGETAMTATITVDGETVREVSIDAGGTDSIALEGVEGSTVALCVDGEEVDRVRPADC